MNSDSEREREECRNSQLEEINDNASDRLQQD